MATKLQNTSVSIRLISGKELLLFRVINIGKKTDEFKFVFPGIEAGVWTRYVAQSEMASDLDLQASYHEVTYHSSGTLMHKISTNQSTSNPTYRNPHGKGFVHPPLATIRAWRLFMRYRIQRYECLSEVEREGALQMQGSDRLRDGRPINFLFFLGQKSEHAVDAQPENTFVACRITKISGSLDLLVIGKETDPFIDTVVLENGRSVPMRTNSIEITQLPV